MQRLNRVGRERAILDAIKRLEAKGRDTIFTRGEICRLMGIKSTSRVRDILNEMSERGILVTAKLPLRGFNSEVAMYGAVYMKQISLPEDHDIVINGMTCRMSDAEVGYHVSV